MVASWGLPPTEEDFEDFEYEAHLDVVDREQVRGIEYEERPGLTEYEECKWDIRSKLALGTTRSGSGEEE